MTVLLLVYNVCSIIVFPSQCHVFTYKLERFGKLLISADPFPSCNCMQIIGSGGNGTQNCDASVQKNLEKKCDIRDKTNLRTLTPNPFLGLC